MASAERLNYVRLVCFYALAVVATRCVECRQPRGPAEHLGLQGVDVIGERVIDEHHNVHDYPAAGGSTLDKPPNVYDYEPGTFSNFDYDSFVPPVDADGQRQYQSLRSSTRGSSSDSHRSSSQHSSSRSEIPTTDSEASAVIDDGAPAGYLLSIFPFPLNYLTPPPSVYGTLGGFIDRPPMQLVSTQPGNKIDIAAAAAVADVLHENQPTPSHRHTTTTAVPSKSSRRKHKIKPVKPSVIIVKKIIPLSTTTYK